MSNIDKSYMEMGHLPYTNVDCKILQKRPESYLAIDFNSLDRSVSSERANFKIRGIHEGRCADRLLHRAVQGFKDRASTSLGGWKQRQALAIIPLVQMLLLN